LRWTASHISAPAFTISPFLIGPAFAF